jgi:hypothetical protein
VSEISTFARLKTTARGNQEAPLKAEVVIDGSIPSAPKTVQITMGCGSASNKMDLTLEREKVVQFCKEFLSLDERINKTYEILRATHAELQKIRNEADK